MVDKQFVFSFRGGAYYSVVVPKVEEAVNLVVAALEQEQVSEMTEKGQSPTKWDWTQWRKDQAAALVLEGEYGPRQVVKIWVRTSTKGDGHGMKAQQTPEP
jgi:hypothetical protein